MLERINELENLIVAEKDTTQKQNEKLENLQVHFLVDFLLKLLRLFISFFNFFEKQISCLEADNASLKEKLDATMVSYIL
jgi:hypothetical protein